MAYSQTPFSASTNGQPIAVAATADPGTLIHTSQAGTSFLDEIQFSAWNNDTVDHTLTLEVGGNGTANLLKMTIPAGQGLPIPPVFLQNSLTLKAYADTANKIIILGRVIVGG
jgi:hypothetical protein